MSYAAILSFAAAFCCAVAIVWPIDNTKDALGVRLGCAGLVFLFIGLMLGVASVAAR